MEIANSIQRISEDVLQVEEGSLYPVFQRMLIKGRVTANCTHHGREPPHPELPLLPPARNI